MRCLVLGLILVVGSGCESSSVPEQPTDLQGSPLAVLTEEASFEQRIDTTMPTSLDELFTRYVISSFDRQLQLGDLHPDGNWEFDKARGELTFDGTTAYRIQVIGTEDHVNGTWLWAWANEASGLSGDIVHAAEELRACGELHDIAELTEPTASLDELNGHTICLIASGFCDARAYYRCPYENGSLFVLITDDALDVSVNDDLIRAVAVIPQAIAAVEIEDQRSAIDAYFQQCGIPFEHKPGSIIVVGPDETDPLLTAEFDDRNWLTSLDGHFVPAERE